MLATSRPNEAWEDLARMVRRGPALASGFGLRVLEPSFLPLLTAGGCMAPGSIELYESKYTQYLRSLVQGMVSGTRNLED